LAAVLLLSLAILLAGIVGSVVLMVRSGEIRAGLLAACFSLLAVRQTIAAFYGWGKPMTPDATGFGELALLAASAAGFTVLIGLWRSLSERDRAETQHWESMEAVRALSELAVRWDLAVDQKFDELLSTGCARFGLEIGVISRVRQQRYEVLAIRAPDDHPVAQGDVFLLADTWCDQTLRGSRPLGLERTSDAPAPPHAARAPFGFGAYLGAAVRVYGEVVGTVAFGSLLPHPERFTATDKDFVHLIAQWIGTELERHLAAEERTLERALPMTPPTLSKAQPNVSRRESSGVGGVDVNQSIRRSERRLRSLIGERATVEFRLAEDARRASSVRVGVGALIESLALAVVSEIPPGGRIAIATAKRHVTIELIATSTDIAADSFSRIFEAGAAEADGLEDATGRPRITVAQIRHLLQRHGGDLSLQVESGVAATFTLYLRCGEGGRSISASGPSIPMRA